MADAVWGIWIPIGHMGGFFVSTTLAIGVLRQASIALVSGFAILGDAIVADMEELTSKPWQK